MVAGERTGRERTGPERYVKESDVQPMMDLEIAEAVAVAVQAATDRMLDAILSNLTKVATGEMRVVNPQPVVVPFRTTKDCWQWMTEYRDGLQQAREIAQIRLEHIQGLMAERDELKELTVRQGREIVELTGQVQTQAEMIREGWDRINELSDDVVKVRETLGHRGKRIDELQQLVAKLQSDLRVAREEAAPPVEHVHDQNEQARKAEQKAETERIVAECLAKILVEPPIFKK